MISESYCITSFEKHFFFICTRSFFSFSPFFYAYSLHKDMCIWFWLSVFFFVLFAPPPKNVDEHWYWRRKSRLNEFTNTVCLGRVGNDAELAAVGLGNMMQKLWQQTSLEPETTIYKWLFYLDDSKLDDWMIIYKWLFQLDASKSLHGKGLFHKTSIKNWLFRV